jgi:hypothetical protein
VDYNTRHPDNPNLMGYFDFEVDGHVFKAWQPANDDADRMMVVEVFKDDKLIRTEHIQMFHENRYGVDVEDVQSMNERVETVIKEMGLE